MQHGEIWRAIDALAAGVRKIASIDDMIDRYLDAGIARILSPEGQKLHAAAVQRAWVTGQPQVWTNSSANESGRVTLGERIIGAACRLVGIQRRLDGKPSGH